MTLVQDTYTTPPYWPLSVPFLQTASETLWSRQLFSFHTRTLFCRSIPPPHQYLDGTGGRLPDRLHASVRCGRGGSGQAGGHDEAFGRGLVRLRGGIFRRRARDVRGLPQQPISAGGDGEGVRGGRGDIGRVPRADSVRWGQNRRWGSPCVWEENDGLHGHGGGTGVWKKFECMHSGMFLGIGVCCADLGRSFS